MTIDGVPYPADYTIQVRVVPLADISDRIQEYQDDGWQLYTCTINHDEATLIFRRPSNYRREVREGA